MLLRDPAAVRSDDDDDDDDGRPEPVFASDVWITFAMFAKLFDKLIVCKALPDAAPNVAVRAPAGVDGPPAAPGGVEGGCYLQHRLRVSSLVDGATPTSARLCASHQWRLHCAKKATLIVSFGQAASRRHVLGLLVQRAPAGVPAGRQRVWSADASDSPVLTQAGPRLAREVTARLTVDAGSELLLLPWQYSPKSPVAHTGAHTSGPAAGDFSLRVWSDAVCSLERVAGLSILEVDGEWAPPPAARPSAGGRWPAVTWAINPQYALCAAVDGSVMVVLERTHRSGGTSGDGGGDDDGGDDGGASGDGGGDGGGGGGNAAGGTDGGTGEGQDGADAARPAGAPEGSDGFDLDEAVGVRVVRGVAARSQGASAAAGGSLVVTSGLSGNVRGPLGELLPTLIHPSLERSESDIDLHGIGGKRKPAAGRPPRGKPSSSARAPTAAGAAEALAAAEAAARGVARALVSSAGEEEAEFGFTSSVEASGRLELRAGSPLILVPSCAAASRGGGFRLAVLSEVPIVLRPVSHSAHSAIIEGAWQAGTRASAGPQAGEGGRARGAAARATSAAAAAAVGTGGGCHLEPTWGLNPQYALAIAPVGDRADGQGMATLKVAVRRPGEAWEASMRDRPVESMLGFYLLRTPPAAASPRRRLPLASKGDADVVFESCFAPTLEATCTLRVDASRATDFVLVPATYGGRQFGPFTIELVCDEPLRCELLASP